MRRAEAVWAAQRLRIYRMVFRGGEDQDRRRAIARLDDRPPGRDPWWRELIRVENAAVDATREEIRG